MLNHLIEYARTKSLVVEPGFKPKKVRFVLLFDSNGRYQRVHDYGKVGLELPRCPDLSQPEMIALGPGSRHFLVDDVEKIALFTKKTKAPELKKLQAQHAFFVDLLKQASEHLPDLQQVADTLLEAAVLEKIRRELSERRAKPTELMTFSVGDIRPVDTDRWHGWWRTFRTRIAEKRETGRRRKAGRGFMRCFLSGEMSDPAATHPKVAGLADVGGLGQGDVLVGFDKEAFQSFGLDKSFNAAMSDEQASGYRAALNDLLAKHSHRLAGAKVAYWFAGTQPKPEENPIPWVIEGAASEDEDEASDEEQSERVELDALYKARKLLESIQSGQRSDLDSCHYFALTLSGASGRVMIRDWMEGPFKDLLENINAWFGDLEIVHRGGGRTARPPKFLAVLGSTVRALDQLHGPVISTLWRCALQKKRPIPEPLMAQALSRFKVDLVQDQRLNHARMGLLKAYLRRKGDGLMTPYLNEDHPHPAYQCGRLMSVLSYLQFKALGDVGTGVVQRYYASASSTPSLVLGRLIRGAQIHLDKLAQDSRPGKGWFQQRIGAILGKIKDEIPSTLTLAEQSLFALGFYHQNAYRDPKDAEEADTK